jgi:hypothetical protein
MIKFLANLFRQLHIVIGITAPPPERDARAERAFVFTWIAMIILVVFAALFYVILKFYRFLAQGIRSRSPSASRGEAPFSFILCTVVCMRSPNFPRNFVVHNCLGETAWAKRSISSLSSSSVVSGWQ